MTDSARYELWYGRPSPPETEHLLTAGPITTLFVGGELRRIRYEGVEICRRVYAVVRDRNWGTVDATHSAYGIDANGDTFRVSFHTRHETDELDVSWTTEISGASDGSVSYGIEGTTERDSVYNRIGICVHHPPEFAGHTYRADTSQGAIEDRLRETIEPQWIRDGQIFALFRPFSRLEIDLESDSSFVVRHEFRGDLFEAEDQRNWTDGSFKSYSTPLSKGWPHHLSAGGQISQSMHLQTIATTPLSRPDSEVVLDVGEKIRSGLPEIGAGLPSHDIAVSDEDLRRLRALRLDHLRLDIPLSGEVSGYALDQVSALCHELGVPAEIAVFVPDSPGDRVDQAAAQLADSDIAVRRFLLMSDNRDCLTESTLSEVRDHLRDSFGDASFMGGTDGFFADVNRIRPDVSGLDGLTYSINPQVHAFDEASLVEGLSAQGDTVRTARAFAAGGEITISPVTLRPRPSLDSRRIASGSHPPPHIDPRQMSLFGAAWTLGSLKNLTEALASSVTYYELTGPLGLMETAAGSMWPDHLRTTPGMIYPMYHVLAALSGLRQADIRSCISTQPLSSVGLALQDEGGDSLLVANLTNRDQRVQIRGFANANANAKLRILDETTAISAASSTTLPDVDGTAWRLAMENGELRLRPYGVAFLRSEDSGRPIS